MVTSVVKRNILVMFLGVFVLALIFRVINLNSLPYGFHVDEVKAGWNAYSILKTGHDDHGNFLPLYYDSFGDFRPTGIIYLIVPSIIVFGNTILATRLPAAVFGALTVFPLMLIFLQICRDKDKKWFWIPGLLLAVNPWHIMVSRATSEVVIAMFLALLAIYFFIKSFKKPILVSVFWAIIFIGISYLFYHSVRVLTPIFLIAIAIFYWQEIKINRRIKPVLIIIFSSMAFTFVLFLAPQARGRLSQVSILSDPKIRLETVNMPNQEGPGHVLLARTFHNRPLVIFRNIVAEYTSYFSTNFLVGEIARPIRYRIENFGLITYVELLLMVLSLVAVGAKKEIWLPILLILISPLPAAITNEDIPNLHRALFMVPFLVLLESYGLIFLFSLKKYCLFLTITVCLALFLNLIYFGHFYVVHQKFGPASSNRNGGYLELINKIYQLKNQYSKIIVSNSSDNLYPWLAFFNKIDPNSFNYMVSDNSNVFNWENIEFSAERCPSEKISLSKEKISEKILIVDSEGCKIDPIIAKKQKMIFVERVRRIDLSELYLLWEKN